eukprot:scaffold143470_cov49-Prasinocladus_malaysianus.AAC.1
MTTSIALINIQLFDLTRTTTARDASHPRDSSSIMGTRSSNIRPRVLFSCDNDIAGDFGSLP